MPEQPQNQPVNVTESERIVRPDSPVSQALKQKFNEWIDERTEKGWQNYGRPLTPNDGRDTRLDMVEEILDFSQYQMKNMMEMEKELAIRAKRIEALEARVAELER